MARPEKNTVEYFPHYLGEGKKMYIIDRKFGNDGYATWYKILEKLGSTDYHYLDLNREDELIYLAAKCNVSEELLLSIVSELSRIDVFDKELWEHKIIWCQKFIDGVQDAYKKRNNKCITLPGLRILLTSLGILEGSDNTQTKVKESKVKETIIKETKLNEIKVEETKPNEMKVEEIKSNQTIQEQVKQKIRRYVIDNNIEPDFVKDDLIDTFNSDIFLTNPHNLDEDELFNYVLILNSVKLIKDENEQ